MTSPTRGYDAGKKISGRKTFGIVDTIGLLIAVGVLGALYYLGVSLKAVAHLMQQIANHPVSNFMAHSIECFGQLAG